LLSVGARIDGEKTVCPTAVTRSSTAPDSRRSRTSRFQARLKGALVTRLARPELCAINTHPVANHDGDWSKAGCP